MFCPQCHAEYRPGFNRCADCDVDLVDEPRPNSLAAAERAEPGDPNEDPFCSFWKGEDPRVHAELCELLEEAAIPHKSVFRRDHLFNLSNFPAYEIGVPFSLFEQAEKLVQQTYGTDEVADVGAQELAGRLVGASSGAPSLPENVNLLAEEVSDPASMEREGDWFPEDATVEVWSSEAEDQCEFLVAALHENGIRCRVERDAAILKLFVLPSDEARARELVREVVEGTPPE